jgi:hypothetical protein
MQTQTETRTTSRPLSGPTLDDLATLTVAELTTRYGRGTLPDSLRLLDGAPACRMLAVRGLPLAPIARFAASRSFPWAGKTFRATSDGAGEGINRVRLAGVREWYPFSTRIEPSVMDGKPCILLDYDRPENPFFIRAIRDELREVSPGLFLGPALIDTKRGTPTLALFFACDNRANAGHR